MGRWGGGGGDNGRGRGKGTGCGCALPVEEVGGLRGRVFGGGAFQGG